MSRNLIPGVRFQPHVNKSMQQGVHKLVDLISPTLGPLPRTVAFQKLNDVELLDKGALIARRMTDLADRREDVGAMYVRHMIWQLYEEVGDGTATAAVLFKTLYDEGLRHIAAGADAGKLRTSLEKSLKEILEHLDGMTRMVTSEAQLRGIAKSVCTDDSLAEVLGETLSFLGEFGKLELRKGGSEHEWSFVEGNYWSGGVLSKRFLEGRTPARIELEDVGFLVTDFQLDDPRELPPILKLALSLGFKKLFLVAKTVSDRALVFLLAPELLAQIEVIVVKYDGFSQAQDSAAQADLSVLLGGFPVVSLGEKRLPTVRKDDFGRARLAWADKQHFGVIGGGGDPLKLRAHVEGLKAAFHSSEDTDNRKSLHARIGNLLGGTVTLWVAGSSQRELERNMEAAEQTERSLRGAFEQGVLAGGGSAFRNCRDLLCENLKASVSFEERSSYQMLLSAIQAPVRCMLENAGLEPAEVLAKLVQVDEGVGFDVREQRFVAMFEQGILDVATVQKAALRYAVKSVALALTVEAVVHKKNPEQMTAP